MDIIVTHSNLDFDGLSSLVAAKKLYPNAQAILPSSLERSVREFMLFYGEELGLIRESECFLSESDVDRLIVVETRYKSRIGKFARFLDDPNIEVHLYDHHPRSDGDIRAREDIAKKVGATSTILIELIKDRNIEVTPFEATVLSFGIYEDTGFFSFPTTTRLDLDMAAFLVSKGASINTISKYLRRALTKEDSDIFLTLMNSIELSSINGVDIGICMIKSPKYIEDLGLFANKLIDILGVDAVFIMSQIGPKVQLTSRSRSPRLDVNKVMRHFDGGGHITAASAFVKEEDITDLKDKLLRVLKRYLKPKIFASDIMSHPVKTVKISQTVKEAKQIMELHSIGSLPVIERGRFIGIVTRRHIRQAQRRGYLHSRIKGYMSNKLIDVKPDTPTYQIWDAMLSANLSNIPVIKNNRVVGIITRSDLLKEDFRDLSKGAIDKDIKHVDRRLNLRDKMLKSLPAIAVKRLRQIGSLSKEHGYNSYLVGGFVRDLLLGAGNFDIDIVVEKDAIGLARIFADRTNGSLVKYEKFKTAKVILKDKSKIDFATAREEHYEYPAALPTVEFGTIKQDLFRRDFTINAMAVMLNKENFGELLDFFGGLRDLRKRQLRALHTLSFIDDPTRIFRAVRFEQRYSFKIEPYTEGLIRNAIEFEMFERISKQRLREELILILSEPNPIKAIMRMADLNELRFIHHSITFNNKMIKLLDSTKKTIAWFENFPKKREIDSWLVYFMALVDNLTKKELDEVLDKFVFRKGDSRRLISSKTSLVRLTNILTRQKEPSSSMVFRALEDLSYETITYVIAKTNLNKRVLSRVERFLDEYNGTKLKVSGSDLKKLGIKPGPEYAKILKKILYVKLDKGLRTKKEELDYLKRYSESRR